MGIAPYKYFTYDGESSRNYDVYLTGDGVFNAPERDVEMVEIPGRNGNYALDHGKFKNISVTYKAGIVDVSESNFADKMSAVRNWLCSKVGYKRLSDDYNPNEYRMAVYKSGVTVEHIDLKTGEFEITFECKPQRWLTSGETAVTVADGGTLDNPTPFDADPLLAVKGYGDIGFNGYEVKIENVPIGDITILNESLGPYTNSKTYTLNVNNLNVGDSVDISAELKMKVFATFSVYTYSDGAYGPIPQPTDSNTTNFSSYEGSGVLDFLTQATMQIVVGTNSSVTNTVSGTINSWYTTDSSGSSYVDYTTTYSYTQTIQYNASAQTLTISFSTVSITASNANVTPSMKYVPRTTSAVGHSTKSSISGTVYIDCDMGECYTYNSADEIVSLNGNIDLGSDLPKLSSGTNTFTYDNTVTELKVTPRWWKV